MFPAVARFVTAVSVNPTPPPPMPLRLYGFSHPGPGPTKAVLRIDRVYYDLRTALIKAVVRFSLYTHLKPYGFIQRNPFLGCARQASMQPIDRNTRVRKRKKVA